MKTKKEKIVVIMLISISFLGFAIQQFTQHKELIIGTWISGGDSNNKWIFSSEGELKKIYSGQLYKTYHYSITEEKSNNGRFTLRFLKLVNVDDPDDIYEYEINTLGDETMVLDYLGDMGTKLTYFTKKLE